MAKINRRLLPIKAHFFFFMAAMGPILPQLPVLGKQIGIPPEVMGYLTSILPVLYVLAKPMFGFVADYFTSLRKAIFIILISTMTLAFGAFYFIPSTTTPNLQHINNNVLDIKFNLTQVEYCKKELLTPPLLCSSTQQVICSSNSTKFEVYLTNITPAETNQLNLTTNVMPSELNLYLCLSQQTKDINASYFKGTCHISEQIPTACLFYSTTFWLFVIFLFVGTIGFNVTNSITDAICFDMLGESEEGKYGAQRVWGTIGFGVTALLSGIVVDLWTFEAIKSFTPALIIMLIFSCFDLLSVSKLKLPKLSSSDSISKDVWQLVKQPAIAVFLVFATIAGIFDSFIIYFMFWHLEEVAAETGFMSEIKLIEGCVVAAECLAGEVPFFFYSGKIIKKLGYVHCMSMCFFFYAVRLALISWIPNPWYLVGVELFFQGCTYALCYTCIVAYAAEVAPPGTSATVQGLMAGMDDGLGYSIGSLIGGLALKRYGGRRSFLYFAIGAICTCVAHIIIRPSSRKQQYLPKSGYQVPTDQLNLEEPYKKVEIIKS